MKRWLIPLLSILAVILYAVPCLAISNAPAPFSINHVYGYTNAIQTGDMMFLIDFTVEYNNVITTTITDTVTTTSTTTSVITTTAIPDETIDTTYLVRLTSGDGTTEYYDAKPYGFFNNGFDEGLVAIYLSASDVASLGLTTSSPLKVWLSGNPTANWDSTPIPSTSSTSIMWNNQPSSVNITQYEITQQILNEAKILQNAWNDTTNYTLYQSAPSGGFQLSTQGQAYFSAVVPYISVISSNILGSYSPQVTINKNIWTQTAQGSIDSLTHGTILDLSPLAITLGIAPRLLTSVLWIALMIFIIVIMTQVVKSYKPAMIFSFPLIVCGALIGWLPWQLAIGLGFFMGVMTWYVLTWEKSVA